MSIRGSRFMWIIVLFDLPTTTPAERRYASHFRSFLKKDGYSMIQYSVYARLCNGQDSIDKHTKRIKQALPPAGHIRLMQITDKQFERITLLIGEKKPNEKPRPVYKQLSFF